MKFFLTTLILTTVSQAATDCNPVTLYRKSATKLTYGQVETNSDPVFGGIMIMNPTDRNEGFLDRLDTTNVNEADATHLLDRQIATICSNQVPGTIPLLRGFNNNNGLHMTSINSAEEAFKGYTVEKTLGYVYTQPPSGQTGYFQVYRVTIKGTEQMTSEKADEGNAVATKLFYSMPLNCVNEKAMNANSVNSKCYNGSLTKPSSTTTRPQTQQSTTATPVTHVSSCNFIGCRFACPNGRCLNTAQNRSKGIEALTNTMSWGKGVMSGFFGSMWGDIKEGWNIVSHPVESAGIALRLFMAAHDPLGTSMRIMKGIKQQCNFTLQTDPKLLAELRSCIIDTTQVIANDIGRMAKEKYNQCFKTDAENLGECTGEAVFQIGMIIVGEAEVKAEVNAATKLERISVKIVTNELETAEVLQANKLSKDLACSLQKRSFGSILVSSCFKALFEKKVVISAETKTPLNRLYKGKYPMTFVPSSVTFPTGVASISKSKLIGEGMSARAYSTTINGEKVVVKIPKFTPQVERRYQIEHEIFFAGESNPNEILCLQKQNLFFAASTLDDGRVVIAMKEVDGLSLKEYIQAGHIENTAQLSNVESLTREQMTQMHARGIVHYDINYENIIVKENPNNELKITIVNFEVAEVINSAEKLAIEKKSDIAMLDETFQAIETLFLG